MSKKIVRPKGLKGNEHINRITELMGTPIKEDRKNSAIELTKVGPDGKVYGIVRENHKYFIKTVGNDKKNNLVVEDFDYIGGLQNKNEESHKTYAKAIKQLNLKFLSLNESFGGPRVNVFENDTIISESEDNTQSKTKVDNETSGDNLEGDFDEDVNVELSEDETIIDRMVEGKEPIKPKKKNKIRISKAVELSEEEDKINNIVENLTSKERNNLIESLKKKV